MEWRCEWCGKPHESDDPPCDNCGHGKFEKAVVRDHSASNRSNSTTVWVCTDCGREHTKHSPPCSRCNNATLEKTEKVVGDEDLTTRPGDKRRDVGGITAETTTVWVCSDCGREHTKHTAACKECGNTTLEHTEKRVSDDEIAIPSYLDLVTPQYLAALGLVLLIAVVSILGFAGVINLPFITTTVPDVDSVPGNDSETAGGIALADVEAAHIEAVNEQRVEAGLDPLERDDDLDEIATFRNQQQVKAWAEDDPGIVDDDTYEELLTRECSAAASNGGFAVVDADATATSLGESLSPPNSIVAEPEAENYDTIGIDVHAVDDEVRMVRILCES